jgi:hypothetical protein
MKPAAWPGRRNQILGLAIILGFLAPACLLTNLNLPRVKNHTSPEFSLDPAGFDDSSCPEQNGLRICQPDGALGQIGCEQLRQPGEVLGKLQPAYPLRMCLIRSVSGQPPAEGEFIYREGCLMSEYVRYVVMENGQLRILKSIADLQQTYAPIENEDEALSYALAATGLGVRYGLTTQADLRYFVKRLEDTNVQQIPQGYQVHLFDYKVCGCGPHPTYAVEVLVTSDGQVRELSREKIFEDPAEDQLCVD